MKNKNKLAILAVAACSFFSFNASAQWSLTGNSGTAPGTTTTNGTNFLGTTDANDFTIRTSNTERFRILSTGQIGIGRIPVGNTPTGSGSYFTYGPLLQIEGPSNNAVPAWSPVDNIRITNAGSTTSLGIGNGYIRSSSLQLISNSVSINQSYSPSNANLTIGFVTLKGTNNQIEFSGEVSSPGSGKGFRVASTTGDNIDGSPWYGLGSSNKTLSGEAGPAVQIAGYNGLAFRTRGTLGSATPDLIIRNGQIGIATTCIPADVKVAINGKVYATGFQVKYSDANGCFPDYVFEKDYKLTSLNEVEKYIQQNKHLPEVPSAKEVEENGIDLGGMDAILLKKIEEMTLHMIEMKKEIERLKKEVESTKQLEK